MPSLPARIQSRLSRYYGIGEAPPVDDFIDTSGDEREALLIRERPRRGDEDDVEISLRLPRSAAPGRGRPNFDELCQIIEGVSHFLYVAERVRRELPATQLELELQAEVDKYILFAHDPGFEPGRAARIRHRLFDRVIFLHPIGTEPGDRYRMANHLAARFAGKLESSYARHGRFEQMRTTLRRFYGAGQTEKIELARAA